MDRTTTGIFLAALLVSCSMDSVLRADETRHQWLNERNDRTGMLTVSGALLSYQCTLDTNEVKPPLPEHRMVSTGRAVMYGGANQF
ncbi:TPA: hypothetical protein ICA47_004710 [Escherichia coli]|nr:hypothetical protein [Escherichia coli]